MKKSALLLAAALAASASPLSAQFDFLTQLFSEVNSITVAAQAGGLDGSSQLRGRSSECGGIGICGMTAEVLIDLPSAGGAELELGLGTGFARGFAARESTLDLHASFRSFPTLSAYASLPEHMGLGIADPYAGVSFGLAELWHARGYDEDGVEYGLSAETLEYGVSAGLYLLRPRGLFVEAAYRWRNFGSVDWELPEAAEERVPDGWPRELDLSGWLLSVGWQFRLRDPEAEIPPPLAPPPPTPAGTMTTKHAMSTRR